MSYKPTDLKLIVQIAVRNYMIYIANVIHRITGYEPGGRRFESCRAHQKYQGVTDFDL
jgi:hypothetical protein